MHAQDLVSPSVIRGHVLPSKIKGPDHLPFIFREFPLVSRSYTELESGCATAEDSK